MFRCIAILTVLFSLAAPSNEPKRPHRLIYSSDADNMFIYAEAPMAPEQIQPYVDEIAAAGATTLYISPDIGMVKNYPSETIEMLGTGVSPELAKTFAPGVATKPATLERAAANLHGLVAAGHDPLGLIVARAQAKDLEVFLSLRLNEVHDVEKTESLILSKFWRDHPEWRLGKAGDKVPQVYYDILGPRTHPIVGTWLAGGLNFAIPEVRAQRLAELRELAERYPGAGIDLDFQRFPIYFKAGEEAQHRATMTAWLREVRSMLNEIAQKRGKPILLSARVMATPEQNLAIGLEPLVWANEGLIDMLVVSHYLRNDYALPVQVFRAAVPATFPIYASIEVEPTPARYREIAHALWAQEPDGIMLFNFFTSREAGKEPPFHLIAELGNPEKLKAKQPTLLIVNKHGDTMSYVDPVTYEILGENTTGHDPHEMVVTPDQRFAYLSNYADPGNTVSVIDLEAKKHIQQIPTDPYTRIHSAARTADGRFAYFTAGQTGFVVEVDTTTNTVSRGIPTHGKISHMVVVSPDGNRLYTANIETQNVSVIDRKSGELQTQIPCEEGCEGLTFTPDSKQLWAANQVAGSITIIDTATHTVIETIPCPGMPLRVRFTADGKRALVSSWVAKGEVVVFDALTRKEIKRIPVGNQPIGIEITPDQQRAFITCMTSNDVYVIDLNTLEVIHRFETGLGSDAMGWYWPE